MKALPTPLAVSLLAAMVAGVVLGACSGKKAKPFVPVEMEDLTPAEGFGYRLGPFDVPSGAQVQDCYFVTVPDIGGDPIWIKRMKVGVNPGSHHFNVFRVKTIVNLDGAPGTMVHDGECLDSANWADWPLVVNSQNSQPDDPYFDWTLPDGVDQKLVPGEKLMLQTHYVNATTQQTPYLGKVAVNFYRSTDANPIELATLFATQQSIRVCQSNPQPKFSGTCAFPVGTIHITAANGHFHSRGRHFQMFAWDGTSITEPPLADRFYDDYAWSDPPMETGLNVVPPTGGGIWWTCEYQWEPPPAGCDVLNALDPQQANDCCYTFGPKTETNEHCNVFAYYWPRATASTNGTENVFCN